MLENGCKQFNSKHICEHETLKSKHIQPEAAQTCSIQPITVKTTLIIFAESKESNDKKLIINCFIILECVFFAVTNCTMFLFSVHDMSYVKELQTEISILL